MEIQGLTLKLKEELPRVNLIQDLQKLGYKRVGQIIEPGDFSVRGNLLDLWLERYKQPLRIDLIGNIIENIYLFNPLTGSKINNLKEIYIIPFGIIPKIAQSWTKKETQELEKIFFSEVKLGDLVVHIDYGVGRFVGVREKELVVEYARGDKLFVPLSQIDRLARYIGTAGYKPRLNQLGTASWERIKGKVEESVLKLSQDLIKLYAQRETIKRAPFSKDSSWQREFEESFPFQETQDQLQATRQIKKDLESTRPMDRLLIGDVGFGKTEVALRAAFKVVAEGMEVAVLVPTTILAEQHYQLFKERLKPFPIEVAILSRFRKKQEQKETLEKLKNGSLDIVVGTHRLLSDDVCFKNLGLVIIDEEHRFGVKHKEKLKFLREGVDVLSLSATPIPRTFQMALSGLREVSILQDPPLGRQAIKTYVGEYSEDIIKEAISQELERKGQVYYLFNRVQTIAKKALEMGELFPKARVTYAHGQMGEGELSRRMEEFFSGQKDILVCTTIIGSGLDMPNVNTIIIENSQKFGLSELHQLRGRVGRADKKAYSYFLYPKGYIPEGEALERLLSVAETSELGGGFKLAQKDLGIRGAGNLLGKDQSGNMNLVGFTLYMQLLNQAVEKLKGRSII